MSYFVNLIHWMWQSLVRTGNKIQGYYLGTTAVVCSTLIYSHFPDVLGVLDKEDLKIMAKLRGAEVLE